MQEEERQDRFDEIINVIIRVVCLLLAFGLGMCLAFFVANHYGENQDNEKMRAQIESQATQIQVLEENLARLESQAVSVGEENEQLRTKIDSFEKVTNQIYEEAKENLKSNLRSYCSEGKSEGKGSILLCEQDDIYHALLEVMEEDLKGKNYTGETVSQNIQKYCEAFYELCPDSEKQAVFTHISQLSSNLVEYQGRLDELEQTYGEEEEYGSEEEFYVLKRYERKNSFWERWNFFRDTLRYDEKYMYLAANVVYENGTATYGDDFVILLMEDEPENMGIHRLYVREVDDSMMVDTSEYSHGEVEEDVDVYECVEYDEETRQDYRAMGYYRTMVECAQEMMDTCLSGDADYLESVAGEENYLEMIGTWSGTDEQSQRQYQAEITKVFDREITFDIQITSADGVWVDEVKECQAYCQDGVFYFTFEESEAGNVGTGSISYTAGEKQAILSIAIGSQADVVTVSLTQN